MAVEPQAPTTTARTISKRSAGGGTVLNAINIRIGITAAIVATVQIAGATWGWRAKIHRTNGITGKPRTNVKTESGSRSPTSAGEMSINVDHSPVGKDVRAIANSIELAITSRSNSRT